MDTKMDQVIAELSRIENVAVTIVENTEKEKKAYAKKLEEDTAAFDKELAETYTQKLNEQIASLNASKEEDILTWRDETNVIISHLDKSYEKKHEIWANEIFSELISDVN